MEDSVLLVALRGWWRIDWGLHFMVWSDGQGMAGWGICISLWVEKKFQVKNLTGETDHLEDGEEESQRESKWRGSQTERKAFKG